MSDDGGLRDRLNEEGFAACTLSLPVGALLGALAVGNPAWAVFGLIAWVHAAARWKHLHHRRRWERRP